MTQLVIRDRDGRQAVATVATPIAELLRLMRRISPDARIVHTHAPRNVWDESVTDRVQVIAGGK